MADKLDTKQANNEIEDDITELELEDNALEKKIIKLESDAERVLHLSNKLLQEMNKARAKREKVEQENM
jgi:hypothetical protein